ncbi:MAG: endo-1,4-beta-xylanase Z [Alistipes sp.]|nr:endo-1,4-beta-xylanase Z [Alistipes sp.]
MKKILFFATLLLLAGAVNAQPRMGASPNANLKSVEVNADGSVTFRIFAPNAKSVGLSGDIMAFGVKFDKAENGVWSATLPKQMVGEGAFRYTFVVDGVQTFDPKYQRLSEIRPVVEIVKGTEQPFWAKSDVAHGAMAQVYYKSSTMNTTRRMHIWTPAGYNASGKKLPVLYLIHGGGDNDASWPGVGKAGDILDNLLAEGKIKEMIVVMPDGSMPTDKFADELVKDIIPYIQKNYRTKTDAANRAIAGLSMGGLETMESFMAYPDMFGYINVMSSGWFANNREMYANGEKRLREIASTLNKTAKLLLFTQGGPEDIAYNNGKEMLKVFDKCGIKYEFSEMPGGHSWHVWRHDLHNLAPRLFK